MNVPSQVPLPCGKVALVSPEDWPLVSKLSWSDRGGGYIRARFKKSAGGDGGFVYLHRFITRAEKGFVVDHIDCNPLNNTRDNLQVTTTSRNSMRAKAGGVTRLHKRDGWRARLRVDGTMYSLGCFTTEDEAWERIAATKRIIWETKEFNPLGTKL